MSYDKRQATEEFSRWCADYDRSVLQKLLFGPAHRAIMSRLRSRAGEKPMSLLDVGCGTGVFATSLTSAFPLATIWGVDLVGGMLAGGRARWQALRDRALPVQGDSERLPFGDGSFDVVTCANSFHHYPHQDRAVAEMHRVLKPGGRLLLLDGYRDGLWGWLIYDICVAAVEGDVRHVSARDVRGLLVGAGFGQITQKVFQGPAPFLLTEGVARQSAGANTRRRAEPTTALAGVLVP